MKRQYDLSKRRELVCQLNSLKYLYLETRILQQQRNEKLKSRITALVQKLEHKGVATAGRVVLPTRGSRILWGEK
jgi:hypothetical protein